MEYPMVENTSMYAFILRKLYELYYQKVKSLYSKQTNKQEIYGYI